MYEINIIKLSLTGGVLYRYFPVPDADRSDVQGGHTPRGGRRDYLLPEAGLQQTPGTPCVE